MKHHWNEESPSNGTRNTKPLRTYTGMLVQTSKNSHYMNVWMYEFVAKQYNCTLYI